MNKKLIVVMLIALSLLAVGCKSQKTQEQPITDIPSTHAPIEIPLEPSSSPIPGTEINDFNPSDFEDAEVVPNDPVETAPPAESEPPVEETPDALPTESKPPVEEPKPSATPDGNVGESPQPTVTPSPRPAVTAYESYNAMTGAQQMEFMQSFESPEAFFAWYNAAKAEYEAAHPDIEIGDGSFDFGDIGGNG